MKARSFILIPSIKIFPSVTSYSLGISLINVLLYGWRLLDPLITILDSTDMLAEINGDFVKYKEFMTIENLFLSF